jgi:membrane-associated phospholipid phosphatase
LAAYFPSERDQLHSEAEAAAWSRVLGGIHWPMDGAAGLQQGQRVAEQVLATR